MEFKSNKDSKLLEFIKKHKTGVGVVAVILIIIISVNIAIYSDTSTKTSGSQNEYYAPDMNRNPGNQSRRPPRRASLPQPKRTRT